jgi:hypothetical protein
MRLNSLFFLISLALLQACQFEPALPAAPEIECEDDDDCPAELICAPQNRCIAASQIDTEAPVLEGDGELSPALARIGVTLTARFTVNEPLGVPPDVFLDAADGVRAPFVPVPDGDETDLDFTFAYEVNGTETEGARNVLVTLRDLSGVENTNAVLGSVVVDFTAPEATERGVAPAVARATTPVSISFSTTEPLAGVPALNLLPTAGVDSISIVDGALEDGVLRYTFTPAGGEAEDTYTITTNLVDEAGNEGPAEIGALRLDFTPPGLDAALPPSVAPSAASVGQRINVELTLDEDPAALPTLIAVDTNDAARTIAFEPTESTQRTLRFLHVADVGEDGAWNLELRGVSDAAGNQAATLDIGSFVIDGTAPTLVDFTQSHTSALASDTLRVTFSTSEPLDADPTVFLGPIPLLRVGAETAPYTFEIALAGTGLIGAHNLNVRVSDAQGNEGVFQPGAVDVDAVPPDVVDVSFTPPAARLNVTAILTVTASEPLAGEPSLTWAPADPGFVYLGVSGLGHQWALVVDDAVTQGVYEVGAIEISDVAGNQVSVDTLSRFAVFDVDNRPPVLSGLATDATTYSDQAGFETVTVTFDVDTDLDQPGALVDVRLGDAPFVCGAFQQASPSYTCTYTVDGGETEGLGIVSARGVDAAGNESVLSVPVILDFTAPEVVAGTETVQLISGSSLVNAITRAGLGATVRLTVTTSEPLGSPPTAQLGGDPMTLVQSAGLLFVFERTVQAGDPEGVLELEVSHVDEVGNTSTSVAGSVEVDLTRPALDPGQVASLVYRRVPWGSDATSGFREFTVRAEATLEPKMTVLVWDEADLARAGEIGRARTGALGALDSFELSRADRPEVFVSLVDDAGNESAAVSRVSRVEWVATLGNKVLGEVFANPHVLEERGLFRGALIGADFVEAEPGGAVSVDGGRASLRGARAWQRFAYDERSQLNEFGFGCPSMVFDPLRGVHLALGSQSSENVLPVSTWDGHWVRAIATDGDSPDNGSSAAFHKGRVVATSQFGNFGTFELRGTTWEKITEDGREIRSMRDVDGVLFGISTNFETLRLFTFDGATWNEEFPSDGFFPSGFFGAQLAVDPLTGQLVVLAESFINDPACFSGPTTDPICHRDLFRWTGDRWEVLPVGDDEADGSPQLFDQGDCSVLFDRGGEMHLLGGDGAWRFTGTSWEHIEPGGFFLAGAFIDELSGRPTLLEDLTVNRYLDPGFEVAFRSTFNARVPSTTSRAFRFLPSAGHAVALTNQLSGSIGSEDEVWTFDGHIFTLRTPSPDPEGDGSPTNIFNHSMAVHEVAGHAVVAGGANQFSRSWVYNGVSWDQQTWPGNGDATASGYDANRQVVVFLQRSATREWNGASWTNIAIGDPEGDGTPSGSSRVTMVFDETRGELLAHDGLLWRYTGSSWAQIPTSDPEGDGDPIGHHATMRWHPTLQSVLLFGGLDQATQEVNNDVWRLRADSWERVDIADVGYGEPIESGRMGMTHFPGRGMVIMGGDPSPSGQGISANNIQDAWVLDDALDGAPALLFHASFDAAGAPGAVLEAVQATVVADDDYDVLAVDSAGLEVIGGSAGGSSQSPVSTSALLDGDISVAVAAASANGTGTSELNLDYVELEVIYTLP